MEKIIQLKESEYNKLFESANFSNQEIEKKANDLYEKKGVVAIHFSIDCKADYNSEFKLRASSYVKNWEDRFPVSTSDKRKIVEFMDCRIVEMMERKFGRQITNINYWNKRVDQINSIQKTFIGLTIFGWLAAFALLAVCLLK